jgi:hypothetical protein
MPATVAVARFAPAVVPSVHLVFAVPLLSVVAVVGVTVPPPAAVPFRL